MKLNVRLVLKLGVIVIAVLAMPFVAFFGLWIASSAGSDRGSPKLASEWSHQLSEFTDPDAAVASNKRVWVIDCENGEWMFGLAQGSHGIWRRGGGTVVTKDSNGDVRSYRGHVCCSTGTPFRGSATDDLATLYQEITDLGFKAAHCRCRRKDRRAPTKRGWAIRYTLSVGMIAVTQTLNPAAARRSL